MKRIVARSSVAVALGAGVLIPAVPAWAAPSVNAESPSAASYTTSAGDTVEFLTDEQLAERFDDATLDVGTSGGAATIEDAVASAQLIAREAGIAVSADPVGFDVARSSDSTADIEPGTTWDQNACGAEVSDEGISWQTRLGDYSNFGYNKIALVHNLTNCSAIRAPYNGAVDYKNGTNWRYEGVVVVNGYPRTPLTTIASYSRTSIYGATPDGNYVGTLTAYCNNDETQECPDYL